MDKRFYWSNTCYVTAVSDTTFMLFMVVYSAKMLSNVVKHCWTRSEKVVEVLIFFASDLWPLWIIILLLPSF